MKTFLTEAELESLAVILQMDHDNLIQKFHANMVNILSQDLLNTSILTPESERTIVHKKLELQGGKLVHSYFVRELDKLKNGKKSVDGVKHRKAKHEYI